LDTLLSVTELELAQLILLTGGIFALIPVVKLIQLYNETKLHEYILFSSVFLLSSIFTFTFVSAEVTNDLIYWKLSYSARNITYFLFFIHTLRMTWYRSPTLVLIPGVVLYSIVQLLIIFWTPLENEDGAGVIINDDFVPYATNDRIIAIIFQLYIASLFLYGIFRIHISTPYPRLRRAYTIIMVISVMLFSSRIIRLVQYFGILNYEFIELIGTIVLLSGFVLVSYVYWVYPESILLTNVQLGGILIISSNGTPMTGVKFSGDEITANPTLLAGIITAIQSVIGSMGKMNRGIREVQALNRSMLVHERREVTFIILSNSSPTKILRSSLIYFARNYLTENQDLIERFEETGQMIDNIDPVLSLSFPYAMGIPRQEWL
jgi:hypothetical protein